MSSVEDGGKKVIANARWQPTTMQTRLKTIRWLFQFLGTAVCVLFAIQGGVAFTNMDNVQTFWDTCHWISEASLYIMVGVGGCILELRVFFQKVRLHLHNFAANRLVMSGVYIWMGCYSMEGQVSLNEDWEAIRRVSGIVSWLVGVANVLISCCSDRSERLFMEAQQTKDSETPETQMPANDPEAATKYGSPTESPPTPRRDQPHQESSHEVQQDMKSISDWDDADPQEVPPNPFVGPAAPEAPRGGWASVGSKPFGAG